MISKPSLKNILLWGGGVSVLDKRNKNKTSSYIWIAYFPRSTSYTKKSPDKLTTCRSMTSVSSQEYAQLDQKVNWISMAICGEYVRVCRYRRVFFLPLSFFSSV